MEDLKTQVISFNKKDSSKKNNDKVLDNQEQDFLTLNSTDFSDGEKKQTQIEEVNFLNTVDSSHVKLDTARVEKTNLNYHYFPKFYTDELRRFFLIFIGWIFIVCLTLALSGWALWAILSNDVSDWTALILVPPIVLVIAFFIVYADKYFNFRSEAKTIDFSKEKIISINVIKLYKRLKTGNVNVNWMCCLTYVASALIIVFDYVSAWASTNCVLWTIDPVFLNGQQIYLIILICACVAMFIAFFAHVYLILTNYLRASKIDNFYSVEIVSAQELALIRKRKNKRDFIIFFLVIMFLVLIGILIYKLVRKNAKNNITINN